MTQEQFEALGIERNLAKKAAEESTKELEGYVKKESYDQLDQEKKQLETSVADHKKQLEDLKKTAGDNAALTQQIADFQTQMQRFKAYQRDQDGGCGLCAGRRSGCRPDQQR